MTPRRIALLVLIIALIAPLFATAMPPSLGDNRTVTLLAQVLSFATAERALMALALVVPLLGTVALHDAIFGERSWWPLASALVVYNAALLAGLLDFGVAVGLGLLAAACWIRLERMPCLQGATVASLATAIFFAYAPAVGFLFLMIGAYEFRNARRAAQTSKSILRAARLGIAALPVSLLYLWTLVGSDGATALTFARAVWQALARFDLLHKAIGAGASFLTYDTGTDLLILMAVTSAFGALTLAKKLRFSWLAAIAAALMIAYPLVPGGPAAPGWIDIRLPVIAGFLVFAGITPRRLGRRETAVLALAFAALIVARLGVVTMAWQGQNAALADLTPALVPAASQDRLLVLTMAKTEAIGRHGPGRGDPVLRLPPGR